MTTMATTLPSFLEHLATERKAAGTIAGYRADLELLSAHLVERNLAELERLTAQHLEAFLYPDGFNAYTARRRFSSLRSFFGFLERSGAVTPNPMALAAAPTRTTPDPIIPTAAEVRQVVESAGAGTLDRALLELLALGVTPGEALALDLGDLDLAAGHVLGSSSRDKTRKRVIPLPSGAIAALESYLATERPRRNTHRNAAALFLNHAGVRPRRQTIWQIAKGAAEAAGLEWVTPTAMRSAYLVGLYRQGLEDTTVQALAGHVDIYTARRYKGLAQAVAQ